MAKKKKAKALPPKRAWYKHPWLALVLSICLVVGVIGWLWHPVPRKQALKPHTVIDSPKTEPKTIPHDIQKHITPAPISQSVRVPILLYHYVEYVQDKGDTIRQSLDIVPYVFEQQLITLKGAGYTFMTAKELGDVLDGRAVLPKNPIVLTFDDGYWDFYTDVLPLLKKYNVKATAYVVPGFTGNSNSMSQTQVQAVVDSGLVEVAAHTVHHVSLKGLRVDYLKKEIVDSKTMLEDTYKIKVVSFAYPNGSFDAAAEKAVKDAGFTTAVSTLPGIMHNQQDRYYLFRLRPGGRMGKTLLDWLNQKSFTAY